MSDKKTGLTKDSDSKTDSTATIWLSGGTLGKVYEITNKIVTAASRTFEESWFVTVQNKLI